MRASPSDGTSGICCDERFATVVENEGALLRIVQCRVIGNRDSHTFATRHLQCEDERLRTLRLLISKKPPRPSLKE